MRATISEPRGAECRFAVLPSLMRNISTCHRYRYCSVWAAVRAADLDKLERLLDADPRAVKSRGAVGETLLHLCYLLHSPERTDIAHRLLDREPSLIETVYTGNIYHGENALHMAIANSDLPEARFLFRRCPRLLYGHAGASASLPC